MKVLQSNSEMLQAMIASSVDGIFSIDPSGNILSINNAAARMFGYRKGELLGANIVQLMTSQHADQHASYISKYIMTGISQIIGRGREVNGQKKNGDVFPFWLSVSKVFLGDEVIFMGVIHDLTDKKRSEYEVSQLNIHLEKKVNERTHELEKTVNRLLALNKTLDEEIKERKIVEHKLMLSKVDLHLALEKEKELNELKDRFITMILHEFRTPLTSILSSASLMNHYGAAEYSDKQAKHHVRIKKSVGILTDVLNEFEQMSRLEKQNKSLDIREVDLLEVLHTVRQDMMEHMIKEQSIKIYAFGEPRSLISSEEAICNILRNIISNAIKYSDERVECYCFYENKEVQIVILDDGVGIPPEDQKHLFTRFFRGSNVINTKGTGLGLDVAQKYIHLVDGNISFESELGKGTSFFITLPYQNSVSE